MDPSLPDSSRTTTSAWLFAIGAGVLLALTAFLSSLRTRPAVRDTDYLIGRVIGAGLVFAVIGLVVYGIARAFRKARTGAGAARLAFWTMATLFVANCATLVAQDRPASPASGDTIVTDAERRGLQIDAQTIRHPVFGFVLPHPGPGFTTNLQYQRQMDEAFAKMPDNVGWAFSDSVKRQVLTIHVTKFVELDETAFRKFTQGVREGFIRSKVVDENLSWKPGIREYRVTALHQRGFYVKTRCIPRVEPGRSLIVCVGTTAFEPNDLEPSLAGLKLIQ
ncbi:MAG TPA: hypothetical protein VF850_06515 [Gemmatimonadaceae bacterium]